MLPSYIDYLGKEGNLKEIILKIKIGHFEETMDELYTTFSPFIGKEATADIKKKMLAIKMAEEQSIIDEYSAILFSQSLVMACAIFDTYLVDCMKVIMAREPRTLEMLIRGKDIEYAIEKDARDLNILFRIIANRVLNRFEFAGINDKIRSLKKIGIDMERALEFKYQTEEAQNRHPNGHSYLLSSYRKRHDIVHRGLLPLRTSAEVEKIQSFFFDLMINISEAIHKRFKIYADFHMILAGAQSATVRAKG